MKQLEQVISQDKDDQYYNSIWLNVNRDLTNHYGDAAHKNWFSKISFFEVTKNNTFILAVPSNFIRDWIKTNYFDMIVNLFSHHDAEFKTIELITKVLNQSADDAQELSLIHI